MTARRRIVFALAGLVLFSPSAIAHFPFIVAQPDGRSARIVMSETLEPDPEVDVAMLASSTFTLVDGSGKRTPLTIEPTDEWLTIAIPGVGTRLIEGDVDLGVMARGGVSHVLIYHAKTIVGDAFAASSQVGEMAPIEIVPVRTEQGFQLKVLIDGKPAADRPLRVIDAGGRETDLVTDAAGLAPVISKPGRYAAWARWWIDASGERDGKPYTQERHYATLVFDFASATVNVSEAAKVSDISLAEPVASFGAVVSDGWLYVYGGHTARRHDYSTASVSGRFRRLNLQQPSGWEDLAGGVAVQGMNLVAHRGRIYRSGGMQPRNQPGAESDNYSIDEVAFFDTAARTWTPMPALPCPRSSHDMVVVGDQLLVIGGWRMNGRDVETQWLDTIETLDLSAAEPKWRSIPQPFQRRALVTAVLGDDVFVIGGFDREDTPHLDVDIFNVTSQTWRKGPSIPGTRRNGFAPAACVSNETLWLSVSSGEVFRLAKDQSAWEPVQTAAPRVAHRMVSHGNQVLLVGGADESRMLDLIEAVAISVGPQ